MFYVRIKRDSMMSSLFLLILIVNIELTVFFCKRIVTLYEWFILNFRKYEIGHYFELMLPIVNDNSLDKKIVTYTIRANYSYFLRVSPCI